MGAAGTLAADWSTAGLVGRELYPHVHDPLMMDETDFDSSENENENVAAKPSYAGAVASLATVLRQQFHPSSA